MYLLSTSFLKFPFLKVRCDLNQRVSLIRIWASSQFSDINEHQTFITTLDHKCNLLSTHCTSSTMARGSYLPDARHIELTQRSQTDKKKPHTNCGVSYRVPWFTDVSMVWFIDNSQCSHRTAQLGATLACRSEHTVLNNVWHFSELHTDSSVAASAVTNTLPFGEILLTAIRTDTEPTHRALSLLSF